MAHQDLVLAWLNDAHGMELGIVQVLERHANEAKDHPVLHARLQEHLEETRRHAELVKGCVERLGGDTSAVKSGMASVIGALQGMATKLAKDELVKNALQDYGTEQVEIASYTSLIAAAESLGDRQTAAVCQQILQEEQAMAAFLIEQIPVATIETLRRTQAAHR